MAIPLLPDDIRLSKVENIVCATPSQSLAAAAELASSEGCDVRILGDSIEGVASQVAAAHASLALKAKGSKPIVLLSGGELTVTRCGDGTGGPNAEYALALAIELQGAHGIHAISCDTDGVDGAAEVAGAVVDPETLRKAAKKRIDPAKSLAQNDSHTFFKVIGDQIVTGPTLTNVNDFRALLILS